MKSPIQPLNSGDPKKFRGWELQGLIGEGGQSTIYLAKKDSLTAALKMIRKEFLHNQKSVDRFFTEIKNLELINHPNIAKVLEVDEAGTFVAIEYIEGMNLEDYVSEHGPLNFEAWKNTAFKMAEAIDYCHSIGIIHKDISPSNVIMGPDGPILIDFGVSYLEKDPRLTSMEETVGTPPYMSPEHFGTLRPKEMDIFSLAGTLIFAATGHYPFSGSNGPEWRDSILHNRPNFDGLSENQIILLSPLLYKDYEERQSLSVFNEQIRSMDTNEDSIGLTEKQLAKIKRDSESRLTQPRKKLSTQRKVGKKIISIATIISILTLGLVVFGILSIQNNPSNNSLGKATQSLEIMKSPSAVIKSPEALTPSQQKSTIGGGVQKDNSPTSKEIRGNLDLSKKYFESKNYEKALQYAKLAANAGNAHGMYDVAYILSDQGKSQEALPWYEKAANLGYGDAFWNLGALYERLGKVDLALSWYEKGAKNNNVGSLNALGFYYGEKKKDYRTAIQYYKKSAELGDVLGMSNLGLTYDELNDKANAIKWYSKASELGSIDASLNLGYLYEQSTDWTNARKYYQRAADKKDPTGMYDLAIVLGNHFGQGDKGCSLLLEAVSIISIEPDIKKLATAAIAKGCTGGNAPVSQSTKSATSQAKPTDGELQPVLSYKSSEYSEKLATDVKTSSIFGRAFLNGNNWIIPLTNSSNESVPPINRVQFRDASLPFGSWWNMPYTLTDGGNVGWQAVISDIGIQIGHSTGKKVCPEFRFALVQNGLVTYTWTKSVEPCTVP